jgi:hypothetical protein
MSAKEAVASVKQSTRETAAAHPNATTSGTVGALSVVVVWFFTMVLNVPMDAAVGAAFATLFSTGALFIGRRAPWFRKTELDPALLDVDPDNPP